MGKLFYLLLFFPLLGHSTFYKGAITFNDDTIKEGLIEIPEYYSQKIKFKIDNNSKSEKFEIDIVKKFEIVISKNDTVFFETIILATPNVFNSEKLNIDKKKSWARVIKKSKISLYSISEGWSNGVGVSPGATSSTPYSKYYIKKSNRTLFFADAGGNKEVDQHQTITITASDINENAIYNWYDASGNLVYQGKNLTVSADVITKYKLEVVATSDGYKDYTEVNINFKPSIIESISPNPANENITVNYKLNGISSAYLMVLGSCGNTGQLNNYILENNSDSLLIETHSYTSGFYTIALVCDGQIVDAKTLIKL